MPSDRRHRGAFTLVEMLTVVVLLGLVASMGAVGLASSDSRARYDRAVSLAFDADAHARLIARGGTPVVLAIDTGETKSRIMLDRTGSLAREFSIPRSIQVAWVDPESGAHFNELAYDTLGASRDYLLQVRDKHRSGVWRVTGLTGWVEELDPGGAP